MEKETVRYEDCSKGEFPEIVPQAEPNKIYDICIQVTKITDEEVAECREIARGQREYFSPLRPATTKKQNDLGEHNDAVLDALLNLKKVIESGAHLA